eukprot:6195181-Pleurochrysis_carterae.AAC.1
MVKSALKQFESRLARPCEIVLRVQLTRLVNGTHATCASFSAPQHVHLSPLREKSLNAMSAAAFSWLRLLAETGKLSVTEL